MEDKELKETLDVHTQSIQGLMDNQLLLAAQVQVLQAALATMLLHHGDRPTLLRTFRGYMKISKEGTPQLARHMEALEGGMLALLGPGDGTGPGLRSWSFSAKADAGQTGAAG